VLQRTRELAMMKVIGRGNVFITAMITIENIIIGIIGVAIECFIRRVNVI